MGAVSRSLEWSITKAHVKALLESRCFYCDACPESVRHYGPENSLLYKHGGIDRINSFIGYTIENTVACCTKCNYAKNDMNITDFSQWVYTVYTHMKNAKWGDNFVR